jgi:hypothetical protein
MLSSFRRVAAATAFIGLAFFQGIGPASAQTPAAAPPKPGADATGQKGKPTASAPIAADEKRKLPDYDGRGDDPTTAGDVLIWVPRVVLSPLYLVSEFVLRRPLGWLVSTAEREHIPTLLVDFFTFGPDRQAGIIPTALIDFGFQPSVGVYFYWNKFLFDDNKLRARAAFGGEDWIMLNLADRVEVLPGHDIGPRAEFLTRPDQVFFGFGPRSEANEGLGGGPRYRKISLEGGLRYDAQLWRSSGFHSFVAVRDVEFDANVGCCSDPTVAEVIAEGRYHEPPGLADGYTILTEGIEAAYDTRHQLDQTPRRDTDGSNPPGSGVRLAGRLEHAGGLGEDRPFAAAPPQRYEWIRYGAAIGGFLDLNQAERVVGLTVYAEFADPLREGGEIPFNEQITLGGARPMRAFLDGRLVDRSAAVADLSYSWPIWVWLDGTLHYAVGNVFGEHLDGFEARLLRNSVSLGIRSNTTRDHPFEILLGVGTKTFADGAEIDSLRIQFGATSGF